MPKASQLALLLALAATCGLLTGCYTRLTSPKEAREYRTTYPELDQGLPIELQNARDNLGSTFIMTAEVYLDGVRRYSRASGAGGLLSEPHRFRAGHEIDIKLVGHPDSEVNGIRQVAKDGTIDVGPVSSFPVHGMTKNQVRANLAKALSKYFKGSPNPDDPPTLQINIPSSSGRYTNAVTDLGTVTVFNVAAGVGTIDTARGGGSGSGAGVGGGRIPLNGNDTLVDILGESGLYNTTVDWHEIVIARRITTQRMHEASGLPFTYWILIVCDLEKIKYEDFNQNLDIRDGDIIMMHAEKAPLIVEMFRTALLVADVYSAFQGVEFVIEDLFKRDF